MNVQLKEWLDAEMKEFSGILADFKKKQKSKAPLWMAACIAGMVALGVLAGYDWAYILRVHFLIGCVLALMAGLCFWLPSKISSIGKVRKIYEKAMTKFFKTQEDQELFIRQMSSGNYGKVNFYNVNTESYPSRFIAGPAYWMFFSGRFCKFIRAADVERVEGREETTRVSYHAGSRNVHQRMSVGVSMVITYKENSPSAREINSREDTLFFQNGEQYRAALELVKNQRTDIK